MPRAAADSRLVEKALALHDRVITIDSHAGFSGYPITACGRVPRQVDLPGMEEGGLDAVFFTVYVDQTRRGPREYEAAQARAREVFESIRSLPGICPERIGLARSPAALERIVADGRHAAVIGMENGFMIGRDLSLLEEFRDLGGAYLGLTHQGHNDIADSSEPAEDLSDVEHEHGGLSAFGKRVVQELNRLGVMVDVSHTSNEAAREAMRLSRAPVLASHSSVYSLAAHPRNMDDETLLALRDNGGVIQITPVSSYLVEDPPEAAAAFGRLWREFGVGDFADVLRLPASERVAFDRRNAQLEERWPLATVADLVDHIDYVVELIGIDHVGIGSDFEGGGGVAGWMDASETPNVTLELVRRGYSEEEIRKIWGGNLLRVWREALAEAEDTAGERVPTRGEPSLAIVDVAVVDVLAGAVESGRTVLVEEDRIIQIGPADEVVVPAGTRTVDGRGRYLIPGLWDMHTHLLWSTDASEHAWVRMREDLDTWTLWNQHHGPALDLLISHGITGIRDMWGSLDVARRVRAEGAAGKRLAPRIAVAGHLTDGQPPLAPGAVGVSDRTGARSAVDSLARAGADFIKVYHHLRPPAYFAILDQASQRGLPVAGHVPFLVPAARAARAGQKSIEHHIGIYQGCSSEERALIGLNARILEATTREEGSTDSLEAEWRARTLATQDDAVCRALLRTLAQNGTWLVPTHTMHRLAYTGYRPVREDPRLRYVHPGWRASWAAARGPGDDEAARQGRWGRRLEITRMASEEGVRILAGTDVGNPYVFPGWSLHEELALLVEAGLTELEALRSATLEPARFLGATDSLGTVAEGKLADLVLLEGNPLDDIRHTRSTAAVMVRGRLLDRPELDALRAAAARHYREDEPEAPSR